MRTIALLSLLLVAGVAQAADLASWNGISISGIASINGINPASWNGLTISYSTPEAGAKRILEDGASVRDLESGSDRRLEGGASQYTRLLENGDDRLFEDTSYRLLEF
jgi:hypothetical protein